MDKVKITGIGGLAAAGIGSVCCAGPVVLAGLGFGVGAISFAEGLTFLYWPMLILASLLFGAAFYFHNQKKNAPVADGKSCETISGKLRKG